MKIKSTPARIDSTLLDDLFIAGAVRVEKKLSKCKPSEMTIPKITNLWRRCPSYKRVLEELKTMPEGERK
jgi:hypothetical protein